MTRASARLTPSNCSAPGARGNDAARGEAVAMDQTESLERAQILTILTTEQYVLQGARSAALADMQGRAMLFATVVSSTLVALALVANIAKLGPAFLTFAFVLLPTLYLFGILTFVRMVQISVEDVLRSRGLARIRHWYVENAPELAPYITTSTHDDFAGMVAEMGVRSGGLLQLLMPTEVVIAFVDCVLLGVVVSMAAAVGGHQALLLSSAVGVVAAVLSIVLFIGLSARLWRSVDRILPTLFPTPAPPQNSF